MSGGSGCQQIKLFVFRPGFHDAVTSLGSRFPSCHLVSSPLSLSSLPFALPFLFSFLFLFYFLCHLHSLCWIIILCLALRLPPPPFLLDMPRLWWSMSIHGATVCVRACVFMMMLLSANEARVHFGSCLWCVAQHDVAALCWWSFCLGVPADLCSLLEERQLHSFGERDGEALKMAAWHEDLCCFWPNHS